jgi:pyruvate/2-oxoglutarate dehydrogenase complex dihydrolipoamide acyltransferase (E2) component
MSNVIEVKVPDIGNFKDVPVIEVLVKPGDSVKKEDSLVTLESDKATLEVPAPAAGIVKELKLKVGDRVSQGSAILTLEAADDAAAKADAKAPASAPAPQQPAAPPAIRRLSGPRIWASRWSSSSAIPPSAACASTSAAFPRKRSCTSPRY